MIPKRIHYCWFGKNKKPELIKKCIDSWRQRLPDFEIVEWNEDNFDVNSYQFTKTAYEQKKWAFVSDVARLKALITQGGFYMDTDVEVLVNDPVSQFCQYENVFVFETERRINTGLFCGCEKDSEIFKKLLADYENIEFTGGASQLNTSINFYVLCNHYPTLLMNNETQVIDHTLFYSMQEYRNLMRHYAEHSWLDGKVDFKVKWKDTKTRKVLRNPKIYQALGKRSFRLMNAYEFFTYDLLDLGIGYFIKRKIKKLKK